MSTPHVIPCRRGSLTVVEHVAEGAVTRWEIEGTSATGTLFRMVLPRCACPMHVCETLHRDGFYGPSRGTVTLRSGDRSPKVRHHVHHCHGNHTERVRKVLDVLVRSYGGPA